MKLCNEWDRQGNSVLLETKFKMTDILNLEALNRGILKTTQTRQGISQDS